MRGRFRHKRRVEAQTEPVFSEDKWGGGQNSDTPASKLGPGELALLRNAVDYGDYIEGHGGSLRLASTSLPGSGTVYSCKFHSQTKKWLLHRGTQLWVAAAAVASWTEIKSFGTRFGEAAPTEAGDASNQLSAWQIYGANAGNTDAGVLYWNLTNSGTTRTVSLYSDSGKSALVARGTRSGNGDIYLNTQTNSGLRGFVTVAYTTDDTDSANTLTIDELADSFGVEDYLDIREYKGDFIIASTGYGPITYVDLAESLFYELGHARQYGFPYYAIPDSGSQAAATPYGRRYLCTYSRIVESDGDLNYTLNRTTGVLSFESPSTDIREGSDAYPSKGYGEYWTANPISSSNPATVSLIVSSGNSVCLNAAPHYTHLSVYGTLDIGSAGVDPSTGLGNNREIYIWIADVDISQSSFSDTYSDDELRARLKAGFNLKTRFWKPIPVGACMAVVNGFLFKAARADATVYYQQLLNPEFLGFYRPDVQFMTFDDGVQILAESNDQLAVICSRQTWMVNPKIQKNVDQIASVFTLASRFPASRTIGVTDWGSFAPVENGGFIARCSDASIRIWDGDSWGEDLGSDRVRDTLLGMIDGSAGGYSKNAYYLWYRTASGTAYNDKCLRLGLGGDAGFGWSEISRSTWIYPHLRCGGVVMLDSNNLARLMVLDYATGHIYWIETFTNANSSFTKAWKDKENVSGGTDIACTIKFREIIGQEESHTLYHQESHAYLRPSIPADGYLAGFEITLNVYADGSSTAAASLSDAPKAGDIQVAKVAAGRRLQHEIVTTASKFILTGIDSHIQEQDKSSIGAEFAETDEAGWQTVLGGASTLKHWLCRPKALLNRATGSSYTLAGTAPTAVEGPDGKTYALSFPSGASYTLTDTTSYNDFSVGFWCKSVALNSRIFNINGSNDFFVRFTGNTVMDVNGSNVTVASIASGWHHFWVVRTGSTVTVYQNGASVGTVTETTARGGTNFQINDQGGAMILDDVRVYNDDVITAAIADYYYDDVTGNAGNLVLPLA
jgi:hypothetical protein